VTPSEPSPQDSEGFVGQRPASEWELEAENWLAWARTPGHDAYWHYRSEFFALVPDPAGATLEVGCGEGRVARDLAVRGHQVTGVDSAPTLLRAAAAAHPEGRYLVADAADLPFEDLSFDLVVAYNTLMDVEDMPGAVLEAARVLRPDGHLCVSVTHPLADAGRFARAGGDSPFTIEGSYLESRRVEERVASNGLEMTFRGWTYPLEAYSRALEAARLRIEALREPAMPAEQAELHPDGKGWRRVPMFLMFRATR
jgi:SAM-dependent methyltransferase